MTRIAPIAREPVELDPRRLFTPKQRAEILAKYDGRCAGCREPVGTRWTADHILPHNQGGRTVVANGQPLGVCCAPAKDAADTTRAAKTKRQAKMLEPTQPPKRPIRSRGFAPGKRKMASRPMRKK